MAKTDNKSVSSGESHNDSLHDILEDGQYRQIAIQVFGKAPQNSCRDPSNNKVGEIYGRCIICYSIISQDNLPYVKKKQKLSTLMDFEIKLPETLQTTSDQNKLPLEKIITKLSQSPYNCLCSICNCACERISAKQQFILKLQQEIVELQRKMLSVIQRSSAVASKRQITFQVSDFECHLKTIRRARELLLGVGGIIVAKSPVEQTNSSLNVQVKSECDLDEMDCESSDPAGNTQDGADALPYPPASQLPICDPSRTLIENDRKSVRATTGNNTSTDNINQCSNDQSPASPSGSMFELQDAMSSNESASDDDNDQEKLDEGPPPRTRSVGGRPRKKKFRWDEKQKCDICGTVLANAHNLRLHKRHVHEGLRPYACEYCERKCKTTSTLLSHMWNMHKGKRYYICHLDCPERFANHSTFQQHLQEKHNESADSEIYHCDLCPKSFIDYAAHQQHSHKPVKPMQPDFHYCVFCGNTFRMKCQLENHIRRHTGEMPFECHVCSESFFTSKPLRTHLLRKHDEAAFECGVCKKKYADKRTFREHEQTHGPNRHEFQCKICGRMLACKYNLSIHMRTHSFKCHICSESFERQTSLKMHQIEKHSDIPFKVYQCADCGKNFDDNQTLYHHRRLHHGPGEYFCDKCSYTFDKESKLYNHKRRFCGKKERILKAWREDNGTLYYCDKEVRKTAEDKYACPFDLCQSSHTSRKTLAFHIRKRHVEDPSSKEKEYQCEQCGKKYDRRRDLASHIIGTHEGGFSCDICGVTRTTRAAVNHHKRVDHQGIRPHVCEHCGKAYAKNTDLIVHVRHHTGDRPFACELCPKAFINRTNLTEHQKTHHLEIDLPRSNNGKPARRRRKQRDNNS